MKRIRKIYEQQRDKEIAEIKEKLLKEFPDSLTSEDKVGTEILGEKYMFTQTAYGGKHIRKVIRRIFKQAGVEVKKDG